MSLPFIETRESPFPDHAGTRARSARPLAVVRALADERVAQLQTALQRAEAERDANSAFLSYISHELRTPLTTVVGLADLLKESQLSADQRDMIAIMRRSAEHLIGIVSNSLDLARLDAGKIELELRPFAPRDCAEECLDLLAASAAEKGIELAYDIDELVPSRLLGDAARLRQILVHLVGNAVKYTDVGEVVISVTTSPLADALHELHIRVNDTGPGIAAEGLDSIFREFNQADAGTVLRHGGTGLGLSISRRLVEMMGGRIWVESAAGQGTTFHFTIVAQSTEVNAQVSHREPGLQGKRVLIVDSSFSIGRLLTRTVERWGLRAQATTDATEAVDWLHAGEHYDVMLIDGRVPDRRAVASAIRGIPGGEAVPLVLLTSLGAKGIDESLAGTGGRARFAAYLPKPVKIAKLHELLVRVLAPDDGRSADGAVTATPVRRLTPAPRPAITELPSEVKRTSDLVGARVVVADDEPGVRELLERTLRAEGVEVVSVGNGTAALAEVSRSNPDVVLLGVKMPELDGYEVCRRLKDDASTRLTPVVLVTGRASKADRIRGIEAGADDILLKPWGRLELLARVRSLVRLKRFTSELDSVEAVLVAMAQCMESRDPDTQGHCARLSDYASRLGRRIGLDEAEVNALRLGGILHDIGKVAVPDAILFKPGPLTEEEWAVMREHPVEGARICAGLTSLRRVLPIIRHHHERLDGTGYPDGLRGEQISPTARVLQIVDIYDALTTKRAYKAPMSSEEALKVIQGEVDRGWRDGQIFKAFQDLVLEDIAAVA